MINFTRVPGTKTSVEIVSNSLVAADDTLVLIGRMAASGSTAAALAPISIDAFGDPVAAAAECVTKFGTGSELGAMVVAAITGVRDSSLEDKAFPPILCIPMASGSTDLAGALAANASIPMPFVAVPFAVSSATQRNALLAHLGLISGQDRGRNAQFGSFGFMGEVAISGTATAAGTAAASPYLVAPWLRDSAGTPANGVHQIAAAVAAVSAANGVPFNPLDDVTVGGLLPPASSADWHTAGDAGTERTGLDAGLCPLMVSPGGLVQISRTVTTVQTVAGTPDSDYFDMQDWQGLYYVRKNAYAIAQKPRYRRAKRSVKKVKSLRSEIITDVLKPCEALEICQGVDQLAKDLAISLPADNRSAAVLTIPIDIIAGFHNKGIDLQGTNAADSFGL
jgi:phage tail sheath gpL-like